MSQLRKVLGLVFISLVFSSTFNINAQTNLPYQTPDPAILKWIDVDLPPNIIVDRNGKNAILLYRNQFKTIEELSQKEMRLAGLRINPVKNTGSRTTYYYKVSLYSLASGEEKTVKDIPEGARISSIGWSPDQNKFAFINNSGKGAELWYVDMNTETAKKLTGDNLNANMGRPFTWFPNSEALLVNTLPKESKELIDQEKKIPTGPTISENDGAKAQNRTYQDLLKNPADEHNFEVLATSVIEKVNLEGKISRWKDNGMYSDISISPDGRYVLVTEIKRPFSYLVPYYRFPYTENVYTVDGDFVKEMLDSPIDEVRPKGFMSTKKGMRNLSWRLDEPATLTWIEALDQGDANVEADYRDQLFELQAPFGSDKRPLFKSKDRLGFVYWGDEETAVAIDQWWNTRNMRATLFNPKNPADTKEIFSINYQDLYNHPGYFVTELNEFGKNVLSINDRKVLLNGRGHSEEGILPFIDELDLNNLQKKRLWRAEKSDKQESIYTVINAEKGDILERIESKTDYPNFYLRNFRNPDQLTQVTFFKNPFDGLNEVHKEIINYKRDDGLPLSATLYLPPNYNKSQGKKMPMIMWAYPREYKDKNTASQVSSSENAFIYPNYGSPIFWLNRGYIVLDRTAFPIVGEGDEEPNDSFVPQLVANAKAAIDAVDSLGYIDRERVGVGGHSYGAFMTANLLTHSDLFAAGIARSGAYNRTLTPFGFQAEERSYWEAPHIYNTMSPFMNAHKMKHPLLLIHGDADNNSGTYPMQSERYFNALKGLGATVRLVMLPNESHGYRARESILHLLWEQDQWLEKHVKNRHFKVSSP